MNLDRIKKNLKEHTIEIKDLFGIFERNHILNRVHSKFDEPKGSHIINRMVDFELERLIIDYIKKILKNKNDLRIEFFKKFNKRLENFNDNYAEIKLMEIFLYATYIDFKTFSLDLKEEFFNIFLKIFRKFNWQCDNVFHKNWSYDSDFWDYEFKDIIGKSLSQFIKSRMEHMLKQRQFDEFIFLFDNFNLFEGLEYLDLWDLYKSTHLELIEFVDYIEDDLDLDGIKSVIKAYLKDLENGTLVDYF